MWIAQGGYEPVADVLFNKINIDAYFMEWDTDRAGFELAPGSEEQAGGAGPGHIQERHTGEGTRTTSQESHRRGRQIHRPVQLCLSRRYLGRQFERRQHSDEEEQWAKLRLVVEVARSVGRVTFLEHVSRKVSTRQAQCVRHSRFQLPAIWLPTSSMLKP